MLRSRLFHSEECRARRVKSPVDFAIGAIRAFELFAPPPDLVDLEIQLTKMGQRLFFPPSVAGWPDGLAWLRGQSVLARANFASLDHRAVDARGCRPPPRSRPAIRPQDSRKLGRRPDDLVARISRFRGWPIAPRQPRRRTTCKSRDSCFPFPRPRLDEQEKSHDITSRSFDSISRHWIGDGDVFAGRACAGPVAASGRGRRAAGGLADPGRGRAHRRQRRAEHGRPVMPTTSTTRAGRLCGSSRTKS